jgi:uncharacterized protein YbgA (DUF1722 family)/uncharacterized protein YbbK (DUF523 family)
MSAASPSRRRIGVSSCLLGQPVRYDAGHKHDAWVTDVLGRFFDFVAVCPEMEIGLGTPRETLHLEGSPGAVRLVAPESGTDHTARMNGWARAKTASLSRQSLCGYILKKDSPSCGLEHVRLYAAGSSAAPGRDGRGLFAAALVQRFPALPMEEEGRLQDARRRENFVTRVFAFGRWLDLQRQGWTRDRLFRFHERHKYVLMAHSQAGARRLGALLGGAGRAADITRLAGAYLEEFTAVMQRVPTPKSHANVLQHVAGYFSAEIDAADRAALTGAIDAYRRGRLPLAVPVKLVRHHVRRLRVPYLLDQVYLSPHPDEMMLLDHV